MQRHRPEIHESIVEADRLSRLRFSGHGAAIAQVYNHMIMPLANERDKRVQVWWGLRDFNRRFQREPEGMWLPETAVDIATLEILADFGISFTILAPHQASKIRRVGEKKWKDVNGGHVDPTMVYLCRLPSGKSMNLFFYDGPISRDIAFGGLLASGESFAGRLLGAFSEGRAWPQMVHIATDGETYGHHHRMGDMALAYCLDQIESDQRVNLTVYGEFLEKHPPEYEVQIVENSAWSCAHGVERWRDNCGCNSGMHPGWRQEWRKPLRDSMNHLRDWIAPFFEFEGNKFLADAWKAREDYIDLILDRSSKGVEGFFAAHALRELTSEEKCRVLKLLEMQRFSMLAFTSCGWFFDEISGIETTQVMRYAARSIQLAEEIWGVNLGKFYLEILQQGPSNVEAYDNGARVYELFVSPSNIDLQRVGAHHAISAMFGPSSLDGHIYCYTTEDEFFRCIQAGEQRIGVGRTKIISDITCEQSVVVFVTIHVGGLDITSSIQQNMDEPTFKRMLKEIETAAKEAGDSAISELICRYFGDDRYNLWHLFKDRQNKILNRILSAEISEIALSFNQVVERNQKVLDFLPQLQMPIPEPLRLAAEFTLNERIKSALSHERPNPQVLEGLIDQSKRWSIELARPSLAFAANKKICELLGRLAVKPGDVSAIELVGRIFEVLKPLQLDLELWEAQNIYFDLARKVYPDIKTGVEKGDLAARQWAQAFSKLGDRLSFKSP
jgi:hypothetical protein